jgi:hypothetical protein
MISHLFLSIYKFNTVFNIKSEGYMSTELIGGMANFIRPHQRSVIFLPVVLLSRKD